VYGRSCVRRRRDRQMDDIDSRGPARLALRRRRRSVAFRRLLSLALFLYFPLFSLYLSHIRPNFVRMPLPPPPVLFKSRRRDGRRWRRHIPLLLLRITRKDAPARTNGTPFPRAVTRTRSHARTHARASRGTHARADANWDGAARRRTPSRCRLETSQYCDSEAPCAWDRYARSPWYVESCESMTSACD